MKKSEREEAYVSMLYHSRGIPLLVSSALLRKMNCGQVDVSSIEKKLIKVVEVKSGSLGPSRLQRQRLKRSCDFLSNVLNKNSVFIVHKK